MKTADRLAQPSLRRAVALVVIVVAAASLAACTSAIMMVKGINVKKPPVTEFGMGPRGSVQGRFLATLESDLPLRPRKMQTLRVTIVDEQGRPVEGATLTIGGGMPQHGHSMPTRPRVTKSLGGGTYEIEGVRFNMGGWWEFKVGIEAGARADTVTFNLAL